MRGMIGKMNNEFFEAFNQFEQENNMGVQEIVDMIKSGILQAIKKEYPNSENINVDINPDTHKFDVKILKEVVEGEPEDPDNQINIDAARSISKKAVVGGVVEIKINTTKFGRVAAQNAKQNIKHKIKDFEREKLIAQYEDKVYECVSATVQKVEPVTLNAVLTIDKNEVYLVRSEQIPGEVLRAGDNIQVYVVGIVNPEKKPTIKISRTHRELVKRLFEREIPEIADGTVEIKGISRVAGVRSKIAVASKDENVDAVGACIGPKKSRISSIVSELNGEKIDVIPYSDDAAEFIARALAPSEVVDVMLSEEDGVRECRVIVPDNQLSLAIGNKGQNAKLAAGLTGYKIDIISESAAGEMPEQEADETDSEQELSIEE